jgi:hypothetical protein
MTALASVERPRGRFLGLSLEALVAASVCETVVIPSVESPTRVTELETKSTPVIVEGVTEPLLSSSAEILGV